MSMDLKGMNSDIAQSENYIGHECEAGVKVFCCNFSKYIWCSPLHYKEPVCCDVQCERRDLCPLSEDTRYMHPKL